MAARTRSLPEPGTDDDVERVAAGLRVAEVAPSSRTAGPTRVQRSLVERPRPVLDVRVRQDELAAAGLTRGRHDGLAAVATRDRPHGGYAPRMKTTWARPRSPRRIPSRGPTCFTPRSFASRRPSPTNPGRYMTMLRAKSLREALPTRPIL